MWQNIRRRFVGSVYATHNNSPQIRKALKQVLKVVSEKELGLNVGAGYTRLHPRILNLDIVSGAVIDCCGKAEHLPFADESFKVIVTQETIEHVRGPYSAIQEIDRKSVV